jgi:8-amino-7-oxononanoate synthase
MPVKTIVDIMRERAHDQPDHVAFTFLGERGDVLSSLTIADLDRRSRRLAARLQARAARHEPVLIMTPPGQEYVEAIFACFYAGAVAVPCAPPRGRRQLPRVEALVATSGARLALGAAPTWQVDGRLAALEWLAIDSPGDAGGEEAPWSPPEVSESSLALLQFTSGSTASPRGVMVSHGNLTHNWAQRRTYAGSYRPTAGVSWLPPFHDLGLMVGVLDPVFDGFTGVLMPPQAFLQRPVTWLEAITHYKAGVSGGPNFAFELCASRIGPEERVNLDLSSWRMAFMGAEPVRAETLRRFDEAFGPCGFKGVCAGYGLAEATLLISANPLGRPPRVVHVDGAALQERRVVPLASGPRAQEVVSCGPCLTDRERIVIVDSTGRAAPPGSVGEIWFAGENVAQGYWREPELTKQVFGAHLEGRDESFLRTGDLGFILDGELFVTGRVKDLIIIRGANHHPEDIEWVTARCHPAITNMRGAAFSVDRGSSEALVIVQEVDRRTDEALLPAIVKAIREAVVLAHGVRPHTIVLARFGSLPVTTSGKIRRHACRQAYLDGTLEALATDADAAGAPSAATPTNGNGALHPSHPAPGAVPTGDGASLDAVEADLRAKVADLLGVAPAAIDPGEPLRGLGLDSAMGLDLRGHVIQHHDVELPLTLLIEDATIASLAAEVRRATPARTGTSLASAAALHLMPEVQKLQARKKLLARTGLRNPFFQSHDGITNDRTRVDGREYTNFSSYNYLGFAGDPVVSQAAKDAIDRHGTSASASRIASGERPVHRELERALAALHGTEDAVAFVSGHATNVTVLGHLFGPGDLIVQDALVHNSLVQGAALSGARRLTFAHNDAGALDRVLEEHRSRYRRCLVAIEGVYSMDGDFPDLPRFIAVKNRHRASMLVDEAHSLGVLGERGRGIAEHFHVDPGTVELWMGTLSKALASCGGYIATSSELAEYLRYTAPGFLYSVGMSPPNAAAALAAAHLLEQRPENVTRLRERASLFLSLCKEQGFDTGTSGGTAVVPVIVGSSTRAFFLSAALWEEGINVQPVLHPAVEERATRLRFFLTSDHTEAQIRRTVSVLAEAMKAGVPVLATS